MIGSIPSRRASATGEESVKATTLGVEHGEVAHADCVFLSDGRLLDGTIPHDKTLFGASPFMFVFEPGCRKILVRRALAHVRSSVRRK